MIVVGASTAVFDATVIIVTSKAGVLAFYGIV
jgi:hypothetical protein